MVNIASIIIENSSVSLITQILAYPSSLSDLRMCVKQLCVYYWVVRSMSSETDDDLPYVLIMEC